MRIVQILPVLAFGDAIGNHTLALADALTRNGYHNCIYAEVLDSRVSGKNIFEFKEYEQRPEDVVLYHMSTNSELNRKLCQHPGTKLMVYHNITPAHFFHGFHEQAEKGCMEARADLDYMAGKMDGCVSDSYYNQQELEELGYECPMTNIPILIPFHDYEKEPDEDVIRQYGEDGYTNILFVGRVVPNKKQEDIIEAFYYYQKYYNPKSRLIMVGSFAGINRYVESLELYVDRIGVENVIFTGQISFAKILAFYRVADVFLCMSEHEGFCVPLVEAMFFKIPIIAYQSTAIADTMGEGGILLGEKNPLETAGMIHYLVTHPQLCEKIRANQEACLERFEHDRVEAAYMEFIRQFV